TPPTLTLLRRPHTDSPFVPVPLAGLTRAKPEEQIERRSAAQARIASVLTLLVMESAEADLVLETVFAAVRAVVHVVVVVDAARRTARRRAAVTVPLVDLAMSPSRHTGGVVPGSSVVLEKREESDPSRHRPASPGVESRGAERHRLPEFRSAWGVAFR